MRISLTQARAFAGPVLLIISATSFLAATPPSNTALKLISVFPAAGATNVCVDTSLRLTFDGPPRLAQSGFVQILDDTGAVVDSIEVSARTRSKTIGGLPSFNYYPVVITGNEAVIAFKNNLLTWGKSYELRIPAGLFADKEGNAAAGLEVAKSWRFSARPVAPVLPAEGPRRIVVAADGSGDFATVQGAIDFVPAGNIQPTTLFIRKGTYNDVGHRPLLLRELPA